MHILSFRYSAQSADLAHLFRELDDAATKARGLALRTRTCENRTMNVFNYVFDETPACDAFVARVETATILGALRTHVEVIERPLNDLDVFERPVFIVAAPRSGSTLFFEVLSQSEHFWSVGQESHHVFESIPALQPIARDFDSNRLSKADADPETARILRAAFIAHLRDRDGNMYLDAHPNGLLPRIRLVEKTPKNALRIPFLKAVFSGRAVHLPSPGPDREHKQPHGGVGSRAFHDLPEPSGVGSQGLAIPLATGLARAQRTTAR